MNSDRVIHRREFLHTAAVASGTAWLALNFPQAARADEWGGFKMGIQSYSLRGFDVHKALEASKKLNLVYWESFKDHLPMTTVPGKIAEQKKMLADAGVKLMAYGVLEFTENETQARAQFDYAKAIGLESISANPKKTEATFKLLDKLVEEYKVNIAIHNHGPKATYDKIDDVVNIIRDHHPRIGACVDTGHYLRSSESPVEALQRLKGRVYGVHLKDVKDAKKFTILGEGDLDIYGCLKELRDQKYEHCLAFEYEEHPENPVPDLEVGVQNLKKVLAKLG